MQTPTQTCQACGAQNAWGSGFCAWCGAALTQGRPPQTAQGASTRFVAAAVAVILLVAGGLAFFLFGRREAVGDVVVYEAPLDEGSRPFTSPVDVSAAGAGSVIPLRPEGPGAGPGAPQEQFGGSGSNTVCDREKLIAFLKQNTDRMRAWAGVLGIPPDDVERYVRSLRPATLTTDTRFTNHSFHGGRAVAHQSVLPRGTAVLVDDQGKVVVRCRCGNPLLPPRPVSSGVCRGCPRGYKLPALLPPGAFPPIIFVIRPPGVRGGEPGGIAGVYQLTSATPSPGCTLPGGVGAVNVITAGNQLAVLALDLAGTGTIGADGSFSMAVTGGGGRVGTLSGTIAGGRIDGQLNAEGCTVTFSGTKA